MSVSRLFAAIAVLSLAGGGFKIAGGVLYGSRCLVVDAVTSFANLVVAMSMVVFYNLSLRGPDADHTYGHGRLRLASIAVATSIYSLVLGFIAGYILFSLREEYVVETEAPLLASLGTLFYALAILAGRRAGGEGEVYARYTYGELLESLVSVLASLGGALYSHLVDFGGALLLASFWARETVENTWKLVNIVSERVEPSLTEKIMRYLESRGYVVRSLRFRDSGGRLVGDLTIALPSGMRVDEAHEEASKIERELAELFGLEAVVHVEPDDERSSRD